MEYVVNTNILPKHQSGVRKKHSTVTVMLHLLDNVIRAIDKTFGVALVGVHYTKVFGRIYYKRMIGILRYFRYYENSIKWEQSACFY